jgi:hypothetical protein
VSASVPPTCPRCGQSEFVVRDVPDLEPLSWSCRDCRLKIAHLDRAVAIWRLFYEQTGREYPVRVRRRAA